MIKELNYYIASNRFSQIAEDIENSVREYSESFGSNSTGDSNLREKSRILCQDHLVKSGLRTKENSFINIDAEFFKDGELEEDNLNRFIKDVLKAHCYQKILWEYMGTTGLMTDISKEKMIEDGFHYEDYLPVQIKDKEIKKSKNKITRNFNKLKDESGFDWKKGYDPNDKIKKNGWIGAFDEDNVWTYYKTSEIKKIRDARDSKSIFRIKLIKTDHGCMLYDEGDILLNPIILWYLTQNSEVYGCEQSDTIKIVQQIQEQMKKLGVEKITQIASSTIEKKDISIKDLDLKYKEVLGTLLGEQVEFLDSVQANKIVLENQEAEKLSVIQKQSSILQKKIDAITQAKPDIKPEELNAALSSGKVSIGLDVVVFNDAVQASFNEIEYRNVIDLSKTLEAQKKKDFLKVCTVLSSDWANYKSCGKTKVECIQALFSFVTKNEDADFSYEATLKDVVFSTPNIIPLSEYTPQALKDFAKTVLPQENITAAVEYIDTIPEQKVEVKNKVYLNLSNAIKNYLTVRASTGMSIKELFDYAIKASGGILPKASFEPPVIGYVTPGMQTKTDVGTKRIFFDSKISSVYEQLLETPLPQKEVDVSVLEKEIETRNIEKPVVVVGNKPIRSYEMVYDINQASAINPAIISVLNKINIPNEKVSVYKEEITRLATKATSPEIFFAQLAQTFNVQYNFADGETRSIYSALNNSIISNEVLEEYSQEFETVATRQISSQNFESQNSLTLQPVFTQVEVQNKETLPTGYKLMSQKQNAAGVPENITPVQVRMFPEKRIDKSVFSDKIPEKVIKASSLEQVVSLSSEEKKEVAVLISSMETTDIHELLDLIDSDWNLMTPLLIKEFLWRKKNGISISDIVQQISAYENLSSLPERDLQTFISDKIFKETESAVVSTKSEPIKISSNQFVSEAISLNDVHLPMSLTMPSQDRKYFKSTYGIETESLSPVVVDYVRRGLWKNNEKKNSSYSQDNIQYSKPGISFISTPVSNATISIPKASVEKNEDFLFSISSSDSISPALQESLHKLAESRKTFPSDLAGTSSATYNSASINVPLSPEEMRMAKINANYEHDKAVLAKSDPVFAKNQFWDVGHAEGNGEMSERELEKIVELKTEESVSKILNSNQ